MDRLDPSTTRVEEQIRLPLAEWVLSGLILLFLFQLLSEFIEGVYAFGLLGTSIPPEIVAVVLFFAPLLLLVWPGPRIGERSLLALVALIVLCRLVAVALPTRGRMLVSGFGLAFALVWLPLQLAVWGKRKQATASVSLASGLLLAVSLSILLRAADHGRDLSTDGPFQFVGWILGIAIVWLMLRSGPGQTGETWSDSEPRQAGWGRILAASVGLMSGLSLLYFAFTSPTVIARWTGASLPQIVAVLALAFTLVTALAASRPQWLATLPAWIASLANLLFLVALTATLVAQQLPFPADPGAYPLPAPGVPWYGTVGLFLMLLLSPVIFLNTAIYTQAIVAARPSPRSLGTAFGLAALFLLLLIFAQVFTTVYDYIPVVGPWFRDRFWLVFLTAGLGLTLPLLAVDVRLPRTQAPLSLSLAPALLGIAAVAVILATDAQPSAPENPSFPVRVATYNIQQGYSADGQRSPEEQLALLQALNADIIGLQETDNARVAGGNGDLVRFFADRLDMYSYYGPSTVVGTFGIALLSRYPIQDARTWFMYSEAEQTALIDATVMVGDTPLHVFVTHLGNGGPQIQQENVLAVVDDAPNVVLMGDFNFRPNTAQYRLTTQVLDDAWRLRWPTGIDDQGMSDEDKIDHIFVSPGMRVDEAFYVLSPASDHPAFFAALSAP